MELTRQSYLVGIVYVVMIFIGTGITLKASKFTAESVVYAIVGLIISLAYSALIVYDTNCLTIGNCGVWSWVRSIFYVMIPVIIIIMMILSLVKKDDKNEPTPVTPPMPVKAPVTAPAPVKAPATRYS
jgi:hypothetical protein